MQEELRCRQLELEVEGLSAKVAGADGHRRTLEESLREAKRERDVLKVGKWAYFPLIWTVRDRKRHAVPSRPSSGSER